MVDYRMIPGWVTQEIALWVQFGQPPGSFVQAVLLNDLADAFGKAGEAEIRAMHSIVSYVYNEVPSLAWRTEERIRAWAEQGGLVRCAKSTLPPWRRSRRPVTIR